jgi:hypothetical protein
MYDVGVDNNTVLGLVGILIIASALCSEPFAWPLTCQSRLILLGTVMRKINSRRSFERLTCDWRSSTAIILIGTIDSSTG